MKNLFNSIQLKRPKTNVFDLSHDVKLSAKMGELFPSMVLECVPGDKIHLSADALVRFAPMLAPIMHRVDVTIHYFFVPNRLVWENWPKFIVGEEGITFPYINVDSSLEGDYYRFLDYMGIPPANTQGDDTPEPINAIPFAAYQMIYNEYYRDQNLIPEVDFKLSDGDNTSSYTTLLLMRNRAYEHDYFTSSLPFAQKGAAVDIPIGTVQLDSDWDGATDLRNPYFKYQDGVYDIGDITQDDNLTGRPYIDVNGLSQKTAYDPDGTLEVQPTSINDLRRAFKLQEWLEKNARGGTRYIESILSHFGVRSSDKRLQRPEYITGVKAPVIISEVLNTTGSFQNEQDAETIPTSPPQGNMAGHGVSVAAGKFGSYYCEEHGYIIGICSVMPKTAYQNGIPKMYSKFDFLDFYWPSFAHLGEQEVKNKEVYAFTSIGNETFGYVPRYAEYKFMPSRVAGEMRTSLNFWHLGRIFNGNQNLNQDFIECKPEDVTRIFAVEDANSDNLYFHIMHKIKAIRPMPVFGTPSF